MEPQPSTSTARLARRLDLAAAVRHVVDDDLSENERCIAGSDSDEEFIGKVDSPFHSSDESSN